MQVVAQRPGEAGGLVQRGARALGPVVADDEGHAALLAVTVAAIAGSTGIGLRRKNSGSRAHW